MRGFLRGCEKRESGDGRFAGAVHEWDGALLLWYWQLGWSMMDPVSGAGAFNEL